MKLLYRHNHTLTTEIYVDFNKNQVKIINHTDCLLDRAFGIKELPTIKDFEDLLEDRCFPRDRDHMKLHLKELGLNTYEPLDIIRKTNGKLEGDLYSLEIVDE